MPKFEHAPPPQSRQSGLRLVRTPTNRPISLVLTCDRLIGCSTHWYANRTVPCEAPECRPCEEGYPWRWHAYLSGLETATLEHLLIEFTARAIDPLDEYFRRHKTMRGCLIQAQRAQQRPNARVLIRCRPADLAKFDLPRAPNVPALLCHIWGLPEDAVTTGRRQPTRDSIHIHAEGASTVHKPPHPPSRVPIPSPDDNGDGTIPEA